MLSTQASKQAKKGFAVHFLFMFAVHTNIMKIRVNKQKIKI